MKRLSILPCLLLIAGCNSAPQDTDSGQKAAVAADADSLRFEDAETEAAPFAAPPTLRAQVLLDHLGFSPGVIDGKEGASYVAALRGFQKARGLDESGKLDVATERALQ